MEYVECDQPKTVCTGYGIAHTKLLLAGPTGGWLGPCGWEEGEERGRRPEGEGSCGELRAASAHDGRTRGRKAGGANQGSSRQPEQRRAREAGDDVKRARVLLHCGCAVLSMCHRDLPRRPPEMADHKELCAGATRGSAPRSPVPDAGRKARCCSSSSADASPQLIRSPAWLPIPRRRESQEEGTGELPPSSAAEVCSSITAGSTRPPLDPVHVLRRAAALAPGHSIRLRSITASTRKPACPRTPLPPPPAASRPGPPRTLSRLQHAEHLHGVPDIVAQHAHRGKERTQLEHLRTGAPQLPRGRTSPPPPRAPSSVVLRRHGGGGAEPREVDGGKLAVHHDEEEGGELEEEAALRHLGGVAASVL